MPAKIHDDQHLAQLLRLCAAFSLTIVLMWPSPKAMACSCAAFPDDESQAVAMAYERADAVFLGTVTTMNRIQLTSLTAREVHFDVEKSWKGPNTIDIVIVRSAIGSIACGFKFRKGAAYLVFANWNADQGVLWTNMCELTREDSRARGLIKELEELTSRAANQHTQ